MRAHADLHYFVALLLKECFYITEISFHSSEQVGKLLFFLEGQVSTVKLEMRERTTILIIV